MSDKPNPMNPNLISALKAHMRLKETLPRCVYKENMMLSMEDKQNKRRMRVVEKAQEKAADLYSGKWDD